MVNTAHDSNKCNVTTSDEPTLLEAISATSEELGMCESEIGGDFSSLESNKTWTFDDSPGSQPLPTHVVPKVQRKSDGDVKFFKALLC